MYELPCKLRVDIAKRRESDDGSGVYGVIDRGRGLGHGSYLEAIMKFEITHGLSGNVLFSIETDSLRLAVEAAKKSGADLRGADLRYADLSGADLRGANFGGADLRGANLVIVRDDVWAVLSSAPSEVVGLRKAIIDGKIDGKTYDGECACLVGTLANTRHCNYNAIPLLQPDSSRPAERFFLAIKPGDTPEKSQAAKLALEWIDQWLENMRGAFGVVQP